jgi:DNA-binding MarR family transcriptional regulator
LGIVQEPLENLSKNAQRVHAYLMENPNRSTDLAGIAEQVGLTQGETADALRGLEAADRAAESLGGWSVLL